MPETNQGDFDEEFMQSIVAWRERHRLREDEAVLLLVELFRIHQRHWDEIRLRELPSFEQFRADIAKLTEAARTFQQQTAALIEVLRTHEPAHQAASITRCAVLTSPRASVPRIISLSFGPTKPSVS